MTEQKEQTIGHGLRELKFRVFTPEHHTGIGSIVMSEKMYYCDSFRMVHEATHSNYMDEIKRPFHIMQYTGLKDKNGVEIYEGDIVKRKQKEGGILEADKNEYICFIEWDLTGWSCRENKDHVGFTFASEHIEVIGNVYQNPELIK